MSICWLKINCQHNQIAYVSIHIIHLNCLLKLDTQCFSKGETVKTPGILDGTFFDTVHANSEKVRAECQIGKCKSWSVLINGSFKATTNYITHIKLSWIIIFIKYNIKYI